jgi:hypothetical protein
LAARKGRFGFLSSLFSRDSGSADDRFELIVKSGPDAGLRFDLANDANTGISRVNELLTPDESTRAPRIHVAESCESVRYQMLRYTWDEHKGGDKGLKQKPRDKYDDYPALIKYLVNHGPNFRQLIQGPKVHRRWHGHSSTTNRRAS